VRIRLALVIATAALAAGALMAPAALAVSASVRAEAATFTAIGITDVEMAAGGGLVTDSDGTAFDPTFATPLNALGRAADVAGAPWNMTVSGLGAFVDSIDGQTMDPVSYTNWWQFNVNGYSPSVGISTLQANDGDSYLFFQNPDAGWPPKTAMALVVSVSPGVGLAPGQTLRVSVAGDDLSKVNSQAEANRFDVVDPKQIETPEQFPGVDGCTIHVGSRVYTPAGSEIAVTDLPTGSFKVWAEKAPDASTVWVRSPKTVVNVGSATAVSGATVKPTKFKRNRGLTVAFDLDKAADVTLTIRTASGLLLSRTSQTFTKGGAKEMKWNGRTARKLGASLRITIATTDEFGRTAPKTVLRVPVVR
jgi:hypothetical protein